MTNKIGYFFLLCLLFSAVTYAQQLEAGFDKNEYLELMQITAAQADTLKQGPNYLDPPKTYERIYRSPELGLKNRWDLWLHQNRKQMVVSIRGTVNDGLSWLENYYCAMIPAEGSLQINDSTHFSYKFAKDPKATVHVGWTVGIAHLAPDVMEKIRVQYQQGIKQVLIMGHSQGGALAFLLTSYLRYQVEAGELPADIVFKTYCSAAPKPGNLYYAYDYDYLTRGGWSFTIVNAADWVPETPFSLQTLQDFNNLNPFNGIEQLLDKQKPFYVRWYLKRAFRKLDKSASKSRNTFEKYLGKTLYKQIKKAQPQFQEPSYAKSMNYMRAGGPIVLQPDSAYYKVYPDTGKNVFVHHALKPYVKLLEHY